MIQLKFLPNSAASKSLDGVTAVQSGATINMDDCRQTMWQPQVTGTPSAGVAVFESNCVAPDYAGTWDNRDTFDVTSPAITAAAVGPQGTSPGPLIYTRWRITTLFVGGTFIGHVNGLKT